MCVIERAAGWPSAPYTQEPLRPQRQLLGAVDLGHGPVCGGLGGAGPCATDFGFSSLLRRPRGFSVPLGDGGVSAGCLPCQRSCSVGSRDRVSILRERQEPPPGRLAPRVLGPAWLRVQPQQVRSSGRQASERPVPCPPLSTQACLGAVTLPLGVQVWKATFSLGLGEANTEMERLFKSPPPL